MSSIESTICHHIDKSIPFAILFGTTVQWRDEESNIARKVVAGISLIGSGIGSLVDGVISIALAILTSPAYLVGSKIPESFLSRAVTSGLIGLVGLTIAQYDNIVEDNLGIALDRRFGN